MLGWPMIFGALTLCSLVTMLIGKATSMPAITASFLFALLFALFLLMRFVRGRA
jgi:hypothetical protein